MKYKVPLQAFEQGFGKSGELIDTYQIIECEPEDAPKDAIPVPDQDAAENTKVKAK